MRAILRLPFFLRYQNITTTLEKLHQCTVACKYHPATNRTHPPRFRYEYLALSRLGIILNQNRQSTFKPPANQPPIAKNHPTTAFTRNFKPHLSPLNKYLAAKYLALNMLFHINIILPLKAV